METPPTISIVVPVYNGEECLDELVRRVGDAFPRFVDRFEVVMVDDGSVDRSWAVIRRLADEYPWVRGVALAQNTGQHSALLAGVRAARYRIVVTMDEDLEHPPEETPKLLAELDRGADVVYGTPIERQHGVWREAAAVATKLAVGNALGGLSARSLSSFRAFHTHLRDAFAGFDEPAPFLDALLATSTRKFAAVAVHHAPRWAGRSTYTAAKLARHAIHLTTAFGVGGPALAALHRRLSGDARYVVRETVGDGDETGENPGPSLKRSAAMP